MGAGSPDWLDPSSQQQAAGAPDVARARARTVANNWQACVLCSQRDVKYKLNGINLKSANLARGRCLNKVKALGCAFGRARRASNKLVVAHVCVCARLKLLRARPGPRQLPMRIGRCARSLRPDERQSIRVLLCVDNVQRAHIGRISSIRRSRRLHAWWRRATKVPRANEGAQLPQVQQFHIRRPCALISVARSLPL